MPNGAQNDTFEVGLVMAGAISAGAYTAGVLDFLIQALEEWEKARQTNTPNCPQHKVKITVMSGTSAGAISAAIGAAALGGEIEPVTSAPAPAGINNKLYDSWVVQADIKPLLDTADLNDGAAVNSVLNAGALDEIARKAMDVQPSGRWRPYIAKPLPLYLCVTNLRGVPYAIGFNQTEAGLASHQMMAHADYLRFFLSEGLQGEEDLSWLDTTSYHNAAWDRLAEAAIASGAFPFGLAPRVLRRSASDYTQRSWRVPLERDDGGCYEDRPIAPDWNLDGATNYEFLSVDGGVMNNEPLELARNVLRGSAERNPRGGDKARRAVVMIDPFPDTGGFSNDYTAKNDLASVVVQLLASMKNHSRFKPEELALAQSNRIFSRFMVAPRRRTGDGQLAEYAIACGALGGFGGFLSRAFREHDFQLGRRNCQQFLRRHFRLKPDNPVVASMTAEMDKEHGIWEDGQREGEGTPDYRPIIPLMGTARDPISLPPWPYYSASEMATLDDLVATRAKALVNAMLHAYVDSGVARWLLRFGWWIKRDEVVGGIMRAIETDLKRRDQLG